jgi:hypothetical protein
MTWRHWLWIVIALTLAVAVGWTWGAAGKARVEIDRRAFEDRGDLLEARGLTLESRLEIAETNFGEAGQRLEQAQTMVERLQRRWRESGQIERAGQLELVLTQLKEARRLTGSLDPGAQSAASQAADLLQSLAASGSAATRAPTGG